MSELMNMRWGKSTFGWSELLVGAAAIHLLGCPEPEHDPELDQSLVGCSWTAGETGGDDGMGHDSEFQRYLDDHVITLPNGRWIVEEDILVDDFVFVLKAYQLYHSSAGQRAERTDFRSTVICDEELKIDRIWNPSQKLNLTYCFDESWGSVPALREQAILAMQRATLAWESAADINFVALENGSACDHDQALFVVHYRGTDCELGICTLRGRAFFPGAEAEDRYLHLWLRAFDDGIEETYFVATHELGHILGLWHEHGRFNHDTFPCSASAIDDGGARGVTAIDADSAMGYSSCPGTSPAAPHPSALDRTGVAYLYNLPRPIMGGAFNFSDPGTLLWHHPEIGQYTLWSPAEIPNQAIEFIETTGCYEPDCSATVSPYWKPILLRNDELSLDVLMYGPGEFEERRISNVGKLPLSEVPGNLDSSIDVPVVLDRFFAEDDRSIWWIRPNYPNDLLWRDANGVLAPTAQYNELPFTDEHYSASIGKFTPGSRSSILWHSPSSNLAYLSSYSNDLMQQIALDKSLICGIDDGIAYNTMPGDFDGDGIDGLSLYDFDEGTVVYWPDVVNCATSFSFSVDQVKATTFRLTNDRDWIMAYVPFGQTVRFYDATNGIGSPPMRVSDDASPVIRDFDENGCDDILWFSPHKSSSRLWQSKCNGHFTEISVSPPASAYPLGYGLGHGRI